VFLIILRKTAGIAVKGPEPPAVSKEEVTFVNSEVMPEFNGGISKMYKWLGKNLKYPVSASKNGIQGKVIVTFVVEKDSQTTGVKNP